MAKPDEGIVPPEDSLRTAFDKAKTQLEDLGGYRKNFTGKEGDLDVFKSASEDFNQLKEYMGVLRSNPSYVKFFDKNKGLPEFIQTYEEITRKINEFNEWQQNPEVLGVVGALKEKEATRRQEVENLSKEWDSVADDVIEKLSELSKDENIDQKKYAEALMAESGELTDDGKVHYMNKLLALERKMDAILSKYPNIDTPLLRQMTKKQEKIGELQSQIAQNIARNKIRAA